jgi:inner membrane protein
VQREADRALAAMGLADAPRFSVPMPFNTLLWRVVAMTPSGFVEGERSLVADHGPMRVPWLSLQRAGAAPGGRDPAVQELGWFNHGFQKAQVRDGQLVLSDLRMGAEPDYSFNFAVAEPDGDGWRAIPPQQLRWPWEASRRLGDMWQRIWQQPAAQAAASSGETPAASASK